MNRKGFMMAEVVVVSAIILTVLVGMFSSFNKLHSVYETRINYNDVTTLYRLGYFRDILYENNEFDDVMKDSKEKPEYHHIIQIYNSVDSNNRVNGENLDGFNDAIYFVNNNWGPIDIEDFDSANIKLSETFYEYINYLNNTINPVNFQYVMVMERCAVDDENDCKYAYLEIC